MKSSKMLLTILTIFIFNELYYSQTGWVQTQLDGSLGYSLYVVESMIYASTQNGAYYTSENGMPWFSFGPEGESVYDIITSNQYILAATINGVYRSSDNGNSWILSNGSPSISGSGGVIGAHHFAKNSSYVFIISWALGIFRSGDDGLNWQQVYVGQDGVGYQDYAAAATCIGSVGERIIIGRAEDNPYPIYFSDSNGDTWTGSQITRSDNRSDQFLFIYNNDGKLFAGGFLGLYVSTDLGSSWSSQYEDIIGAEGEVIGLGTFRDIVAYNQILIAAVDAKSIQISGDEGKNWISFNEGLITDWTFGALAVKPPYIWALRNYFGNAYRRNINEVVTNINDIIHDIPSTYLLDQNYPNPFNPTTQIRYTLPKDSHITLRIYDVLGTEVLVLENGYKSAGTYSYSFDASNLSSGIYFYTIRAKNFVGTKKMLLLK